MDRSAGVCTICLELLKEEVVALPCGHPYHAKCVVAWHAQQHASAPGKIPLCAVCKTPSTSRDVVRLNFQPMRAIRAYMERVERQVEREVEKANSGNEQRPQEEETKQKMDVEWKEESMMEGADNDAAAAAAAANDVAASSSSAVVAPAASSSSSTDDAYSAPSAASVLLYSHPLFYRLQLSGLDEKLAEVEEEHSAILPKYSGSLERLEAAQAELASLKAQLERASTDRRVAREERDAAQLTLDAARASELPLRRAREVLMKHKTVWAIVQHMGERQAQSAIQQQQQQLQEGGDLAAAAAVGGSSLSLSAQLSSGLHQFDPESHALWVAGSAAMSPGLQSETRLCLLQAHASFLRTLLASANSARLARKTASEQRARQDYSNSIARLQRAAHARIKHIAQTKEDIIDKEYKIAMLRRQLEQMKRGGPPPTALEATAAAASSSTAADAAKATSTTTAKNRKRTSGELDSQPAPRSSRAEGQGQPPPTVAAATASSSARRPATARPTDASSSSSSAAATAAGSASRSPPSPELLPLRSVAPPLPPSAMRVTTSDRELELLLRGMQDD